MNPDHIFGIVGLTPGGLGIWTIAAGLLAWWIRGMPDRQRSRNESVTAEGGVYKELFDRMQAEISRLDQRVAALERDLRECERARALAETEAMRLKAINDVRGDSRRRAQEIVAAGRATNSG